MKIKSGKILFIIVIIVILSGCNVTSNLTNNNVMVKIDSIGFSENNTLTAPHNTALVGHKIVAHDYVTDSLFVYDVASRGLTNRFGGKGSAPGLISFCQSICSDGAGNLLVSEMGSKRIQKFNLKGESIDIIKVNGLPGPIMHDNSNGKTYYQINSMLPNGGIYCLENGKSEFLFDLKDYCKNNQINSPFWNETAHISGKFVINLQQAQSFTNIVVTDDSGKVLCDDFQVNDSNVMITKIFPGKRGFWLAEIDYKSQMEKSETMSEDELLAEDMELIFENYDFDGALLEQRKLKGRLSGVIIPDEDSVWIMNPDNYGMYKYSF